ncbi:hypothetical protein BBJ28_00005207 [Nothophytophthora sp. Chile5]|nr:hypothetical protein BBJ28_00005207 [Nothophytophthora sp. Chile5]
MCTSSPPQALADYHHALELLPGNGDIQSRVALVHYQFGVELFNRALFDKAELEFGNAIAQDAKVAAYYVRRGDAARYLEKHQAACADYQQALRLNPNDRDTHVNVTEAHNSFKKKNQRVQELFRNRPVVPPPSMNTLK